MGSTFEGDISSGELLLGIIQHTSVASNGAGAIIGGTGQVGTTTAGPQMLRAPQAGVITSVWWEPTDASLAATSSASYRQLSIIDAGQTGTGTAVLASMAATATQASFSTAALNLATASQSATSLKAGTVTVQGIATTAYPTVAAGDIIAASHATVGGNSATNTEVRAGQFHIHYRPI